MELTPVPPPDGDDEDVGNPQAPPGWRPDEENTTLDPSYVRKPSSFVRSS